MASFSRGGGFEDISWIRRKDEVVVDNRTSSLEVGLSEPHQRAVTKEGGGGGGEEKGSLGSTSCGLIVDGRGYIDCVSYAG